MEIRNPEIEALMAKLGEAIMNHLPHGMGFTLLMYDFGPGGAMFYMSNAQRHDMIRAIKEHLDMLENQPDVQGVKVKISRPH